MKWYWYYCRKNNLFNFSGQRPGKPATHRHHLLCEPRGVPPCGPVRQPEVSTSGVGRFFPMQDPDPDIKFLTSPIRCSSCGEKNCKKT